MVSIGPKYGSLFFLRPISGQNPSFGLLVLTKKSFFPFNLMVVGLNKSLEVNNFMLNCSFSKADVYFSCF